MTTTTTTPMSTNKQRWPQPKRWRYWLQSLQQLSRKASLQQQSKDVINTATTTTTTTPPPSPSPPTPRTPPQRMAFLPPCGWKRSGRQYSNSWESDFSNNLVGLRRFLVVCFLSNQSYENYLLWEKMAQLPFLSQFFLGWIGLGLGSSSVS